MNKATGTYMWLDWVRTIGIFLVVLGHTGLSEGVQTWIYSFHMPLFFVISGLLLHINKYNSWAQFLKTKAKQLLLPYLFFNVISYLLWLIKVQIEHDCGVDYIGEFARIFYFSPVAYNAPLWFLPALFVVEMMAYIFVKYDKVFLGFIITLFGGWVTEFMPRLPLFFDIAVSAAAFYLFAVFCKKIILKIAKITITANVFFIITSFGLSLLLAYINGRIDISSNQFGSHYLLFWLAALVGIVFVFFVGQLSANVLGDIKIVKYISRNTIVILVLHIPVMTTVKVMSNIVGFSYFNTENLLICCCFSGIIIVLLYPVTWFINNYIPILIGRKL